MRRTLTVSLAPTKRTDLICVSCGMFRTELAILFRGAEDGDAGAWAGVHRHCVKTLRRRRAAPEADASPEPLEDGVPS